MPTIEIVSFQRQSLIRIPRKKLCFAIRQQSKLISHRGLFQDYLDKENGTILHLGNLNLYHESYFFAGDLIDWDFEDEKIYIPVIDATKSLEEQWLGKDQMKKFKFKNEYVKGIDYLITKALRLSPIKKACILTDTQFGPEIAQYSYLNGVKEFWDIHMKGLEWNTMYIIDAGNFRM